MIRSAFATIGALLLSLTAYATPVDLGYAAGYNVFTFGNYYSQSHVGGRVAVGGSLNSNLEDGSGGSAEWERFSSTTAFTVIGGSNGANTIKQSGPGGLYIGSRGTGSVGTIGSGKIDTLNANPIDFASTKTYLTGLSSSLSGYATSGVTIRQDGSGYILTASSPVSIVNLTRDEFGVLDGIVTNGNTVIVNINDGGVVTYKTGHNFWVDDGSGKRVQPTAGLYDASKVLFNFATATTLQLEGQLGGGTILAPNAALTDGNNGNGGSQFNGQIIVDSMRYTGEIHGTGSRAESPVPEPSTLVLLGSGLVGIWKLRGRRLR